MHVFPRVSLPAEEAEAEGSVLSKKTPQYLVRELPAHLRVPSSLPRGHCHGCHARRVSSCTRTVGSDTARPCGVLRCALSCLQCAIARMSTYQKVVGVKTVSFTQRKRLLKALQQMTAQVEDIEQRLFTMQPLEPDEQELYEAVGDVDSIKEKVAWLSAEQKGMVERGELTAAEKEQVLAQTLARAEAIEAELEKARAEEKPKKLAQLEKQLAASRAREEHVEAIKPIVHRVKHGDTIQKLRREIKKLEALEKRSKGGFMSIAELKQIKEKDTLQEKLATLIESSKGWFA